MGSLENNVSRKVKFVDVTGYTPTQIENKFNDDYGSKGWRLIQIYDKGTKTYIMAEREE